MTEFNIAQINIQTKQNFKRWAFIIINIYTKTLVIHMYQQPDNTYHLKLQLASLTPKEMAGVINGFTQEQLINLVKSNCKNNPYQLNLSCTNVEKMANIKLAFLKYLKKADISYKFNLYQNKSYLEYQSKKFLQIILQENSANFTKFPEIFQSIMLDCSSFVSEQLRQQFSQQLQNIFLDPCLPIPKLVRQSVSSMVSGPLQNYLISKIENQDYLQNIHEQIFEKVNELFYESQQKILKNLIGNYQLASQLNNSAYNITFQNYRSKFIQGNQLHNLLVSIFGYTDLLLQLTLQHLKTINNPFQLFVQFCSRYTIFQNIMMGVEDNLGNLFKIYGLLYNQLFNKFSDNLSYWKYALVMWIKKMNQFHQSNHKIYVNLIMYISNRNLLNFKAANKDIQLLILQFIQQQDNSNQHNLKCNQIFKIIAQQQSQIRIILDSYQEYLVDSSINQVNITSCGHSQQQLDEIYMQSQKIFVDEEINFNKCFTNMFVNKITRQEHEQITRSRLKLYQEILKPRTLLSILKIYDSGPTLMLRRKIECKDKIIQNYIQNLMKKRPNWRNKQKYSMYRLAIGYLDKELPETVDSQQQSFDQSFEFYDSQGQQQNEANQNKDNYLDIEKRLSKTN